MILDICNRFAGPNANLSDLRLATICVTAYTTFLRYNELTIGFLSVMEGGKRIKLKTVILRTNYVDSLLKVSRSLHI